MDKRQQIRDFLESKIKEKGMSLNSLSLKLGKNSTYLFHFIKRKSPKRLDENARRKLALILEVSEQELCDFPLPSSVIQDKFSPISSLFNFKKSDSDDIIAIDVIDMEGPNKGRFERIKNNLIGQEFMNNEVVKMYTSSDPRNLKIIKISGEAMSPTINHGDIIWLDMSYSTPVSDGVYIINTAGDIVIRRLQINPFDNSIEVSADNTAYKSFNITDYKSLNICGKVVFIARRMN